MKNLLFRSGAPPLSSSVAFAACQYHQTVIKPIVKRKIFQIVCFVDLGCTMTDRFLGTNSKVYQNRWRGVKMLWRNFVLLLSLV